MGLSCRPYFFVTFISTALILIFRFHNSNTDFGSYHQGFYILSKELSTCIALFFQKAPIGNISIEIVHFIKFY